MYINFLYIYSPACCSKPVWLLFFSENTKQDVLKDVQAAHRINMGLENIKVNVNNDRNNNRISYVQEGTVHIIYAMLERPILSLHELNISRLQTGVQRVLLLRPDAPAPALPRDVRTLEVLAPEVTIPTQETTYWCYIYQLPPSMPKNHIVMVTWKSWSHLHITFNLSMWTFRDMIPI